MVKAIIFDCFGVLTESSWQEFWSSLPTKEMQKQSRELNRAYDSGNINKEEFSIQLREITGCPETDIQRIFFDTEPVKNTKLIEYIRSLKPEYKIGILSNIASTWIEDHLLTQDESNLFDDMVFSFQVGMAKPNIQIFKLAAERLGLQPDECIMVDDIESYCMAANEAGMQAILYKDFEQMISDLEQILSS